MEPAEVETASSEEDLAWVAAAAVLAWAAAAGASWIYLRSFSFPFRCRSWHPCRALQPSPQRHWRHIRWLINWGKASPQSCKIISATSVASRGKMIPYIWREMASALTKAEVLALLSQFFLKGISAYL